MAAHSFVEMTLNRRSRRLMMHRPIRSLGDSRMFRSASRTSIARLPLAGLAAILVASAARAQPEPQPELVLQTWHNSAASSMALSSDGKWLVTGSHDRTARLWETSTHRLVR